MYTHICKCVYVYIHTHMYTFTHTYLLPFARLVLSMVRLLQNVVCS